MFCIFCDNIEKKDIINETKNFYWKVGRGIITAGHTMIIPKKHYTSFGDIDYNIIQEFLDLKKLVENKIADKFSKPFMVEYGAFGQSICHAHIHFIPKSGNNYNNINIINDFVNKGLNKLNLKSIQIKNFKEISKYYQENKRYLYFEDEEEKNIIPITKEVENNLDLFNYRLFFTKIGVKGIKSWANMTEQEKKYDNIKINQTIEKLS